MPRLVGQRSNTGRYILLLIVLVLVVAVLLEFLGVSDLIGGFGAATTQRDLLALFRRAVTAGMIRLA